MSILLIGVLSAVIATQAPAAVSNLVTQTSGSSAALSETNDPVELELKKLMKLDDAAAAEVDGWIRENQEFKEKGAAVPNAELNRRILKRFEPVRQGYEDLIKRYPTNADVRVAFASLLNDLGDHDGQVEQLEKARELDPKDPAIWNNLANFYGEFSPVKKAFAYYEKAIDLDSNEPVYYQNFATTVCVFRKDAREYYHITEKEVFEKSLALYAKALKLDPGNFPLATDLAETYYLMRPVPTDEALQSWTNALRIAHTEVEREGVYVHMARLNTLAGRFAEARAHLNAVTNAMYSDLKEIGFRNIERREKDKAGAETNSPPSEISEPRKEQDTEKK
jgi:tetratricopeptide (TPR) repeat protein